MYENKTFERNMLHYQTAQKSIVLYDRVTSIFENEAVSWHFDKKKQLKTASQMHGNPTEIVRIRKDQFRILRSLKFGENR